MSPEQLAQEEKAKQFQARCRSGFQNEHHWQRWLDLHSAEIFEMPVALKEAVLLAWVNASTPEASRASARSALK